MPAFKLEYYKKLPSPEGKSHYRPKYETKPTVLEFENISEAIDAFTTMIDKQEDISTNIGDPDKVIEIHSDRVVFTKDQYSIS